MLLGGISIEQLDICYPDKTFYYSYETVGFHGFSDLSQFNQLLKCLDNVIYWYIDDEYLILSACREDIRRIINPIQSTGENSFIVKINNEQTPVYVFGEREGDLPVGFLEQCICGNQNVANFMKENFKIYIQALDSHVPNEICKDFFEREGFEIPENRISVVSQITEDSLFKRVYSTLRLIIAKLLYKH